MFYTLLQTKSLAKQRVSEYLTIYETRVCLWTVERQRANEQMAHILKSLRLSLGESIQIDSCQKQGCLIMSYPLVP